MKKAVRNVMVAGTRNVNMPIYTKTGDDGTTTLFGGKKVLKSDPQIASYGTIDELSGFIGLVIIKITKDDDKEILIKIQKDLYQIMSVLSGAQTNLYTLENKIKKFEQIIDKLQSQIPEVNRFVLPGGTEISAWFHVLRTICRRSERTVIKYISENKKETDADFLILIKYLNRLSDLFFIFARFYNQKKEQLI